jgi:hypothetical protein
MDFGLDIFISDPFFYIYRRLRKVRKRLSFAHEKNRPEPGSGEVPGRRYSKRQKIIIIKGS